MIFEEENLEENEETLRKIKQYSILEGVLKKKRRSTFFGFGNQSQNTYFAFFQKGKILVYWRSEKKPLGYGYNTRPKWACFTRNIIRIEENYQKKKNHFNLVCRNSKNLHLKHDNEKQANKWVETLSFLSSHYKFAQQEDWEVDDYNTIDSRVMLVIMVEQEQKHWAMIKDQLDTQSIHRTKGIYNYLNRIGYGRADSCFADGPAKIAIIKQDSSISLLDKDFTRTTNNSGNNFVTQGNKVLSAIGMSIPHSKNLDTTVRRYAFLITQKGIDYLNTDKNNVISDHELPPIVNFDTIYIAPFADEHDNSRFELTIVVKDILCSEVQEDFSNEKFYIIRQELVDQVYFLGFETAHECQKWITIIRKSKENREEIDRLKYKEFKINIDSLIYKYRYLKIDAGRLGFDDFNDHVKLFDVKRVPLVTAMKILNTTLVEYNYTLDALQAKRPFYKLLHKCYSIDFHIGFFNWVVDLWNHRRKDYCDEDVLSFIDILYKEKLIQEEYGLNDCRFNKSITSLVSTFCLRIFKRYMPLILEFIHKMRKGYTKSPSGALESNVPYQLFIIINNIFSYYFHAPYDNILRAILSLCFKIIINFQKEFIDLTKNASGFTIEDQAIFTNSTWKFIECTRDFTIKCAKSTGHDRYDIDLMFSFGQILQGFGRADNEVFIRIKKIIEDKIVEAFSQIKSHITFKMEHLLGALNEGLTEIMPLLYHLYSRKIWKFVLSEITINYIKMILCNIRCYTNEIRQQFFDKIDEEMQIIINTFKGLVLKKYSENAKQQLEWTKNLITGNDVEFIGAVGQIKLQLGNEFSIKVIQTLLNFRTDLPNESRKQCLELMRQRSGVLRSAERKEIQIKFYNSAITILVVKKFVMRQKDKVFQKKQDYKKALLEAKQNSFLFISSIDSEKKDLEDVVKKMYGEVDLCINTDFHKSHQNKNGSADFIKNQLKKCKFKKKLIWFSEELLCWKDRKDNGSEAQGRIWIANISDMKIYEKNKQKEIYFYFQYGSDQIIIKFVDDATCRSWSKAIVYQNFKYIKKTSKIVFQNFEAISPDQKYEEYFICDEINYDYVGIKYDKLIDIEKRKFDQEKIDFEDKELQNIAEDADQLEDEIIDLDDLSSGDDDDLQNVKNFRKNQVQKKLDHNGSGNSKNQKVNENIEKERKPGFFKNLFKQR